MEYMRTSNFAAHIGLDWGQIKALWPCASMVRDARGNMDITSPEAIDLAQNWSAFRRAAGGAGFGAGPWCGDCRALQICTWCCYPCIPPAWPTTEELLSLRSQERSGRWRPHPGLSGQASPSNCGVLQPDTVATRSLQFLTSERRALVDQHTAVVQSLTHWLKQVFPQVVRWFGDLSTPLVADLLPALADLAGTAKGQTQNLASIFAPAQLPQVPNGTRRLEEFRQAVPATDDPALLQTASYPFTTLSESWPSCGKDRRVDRQIAPHLSRPSRPLHHRVAAWGGTGAGAPPDCRCGVPAGAFRIGPQHGMLFWHSTR